MDNCHTIGAIQSVPNRGKKMRKDVDDGYAVSWQDDGHCWLPDNHVTYAMLLWPLQIQTSPKRASSRTTFFPSARRAVIV